MKRILLVACAFLHLVCLPAWAQQVNPNVWVAIDYPSEGAVFNAPANVAVGASAGIYDDGVFVQSLRIQQGATIVASGSGESISYTFQNLPIGTYTFTARAQSNLNRTATATRTFTVIASGDRPPSISLNQATGQPFIGPATVNLTSNASDADGYVVGVDYYANGQHIGHAGGAPYALSWSNVAPGQYAVTGVATDNNGKTTTSAALTVVVAQSVIRGNIDGVISADGGYHVTGWACSSGRTAPVDVHVYAGGASPVGTNIAVATANQSSEPAVAAACEVGQGSFRFRVPLSAGIRQAHANEPLYVHGISPAGAAHDLLGNSGTFRVPPPLQARRRYVYDAQQRLCKTIEPETGAAVIAYDAVGNVAWSASGLDLPDPVNCNRTEALASGRAVQRSYDSRNRLKTLRFPDRNGDQDWDYAADGLPTRVTTLNNEGATSVVNTYAYNKRRLLTHESVGQSSWYTWGMGYAYDANGNLSSHTYPTGLIISYSPDALGRPTRVADQFGGVHASGVSYHPNGAISQFTYGNGVLHGMVQNARQLPQQVRDVNVLSYEYQYDQNGNVSSIYDQQQGGPYDRHMQYDGLNRLTAAGSVNFGGDWWHRYTYDALDNIRSSKLGGVKEYNYWYDARNQLTNVRTDAGATTIGFSYDAQGNMASKNGRTYRFDYGNRLREVGGLESYRYDSLGRRVTSADTGGSRLVSMYGRDGSMFYEERRAAGRREHIYLQGSVIAIRTDLNTLDYQHTDALGSPVAMTNSSGQVVERTHYDPYGAPIGKAVDGIGYTGHLMDGASGLTYMQQRYYDPTIGVFMSTDPVSSDFSRGSNFNRYAYVDNNPYKSRDPDGRYKCTASEGACKMVAVAVRKIRSSAEAQTGSRIPNGRSAQVAIFLGKEDDGNGVTIQDGAAGSAGNAITEGGSTKISINFSGLKAASSQFKGFNYQDLVDSTVIHEGSHGYDQSMRLKNGFTAMTRSRHQFIQGERRAYKAEAAFYESLQTASPWGLWTPGGGRDNDYIEQQVNESVKITCSIGRCKP